MLLCEGWTDGFRVVTDGSDQVRVRQGRVQFVGGDTKGEEHDQSDGEWFLEVRLHDGDEVVLHAEIENQPEAESASNRIGRLDSTVVGVSKVKIT